MMEGFQEFKLKRKKGIDDLKCLFAFSGNSQGDESQTNNIQEYKSSGGWLSFNFDCELTEEAINKEIEIRKNWNEKYIQELKEKGQYNEEYEITINFKSCSELDNTNINLTQPLESCKFLIFEV